VIEWIPACAGMTKKTKKKKKQRKEKLDSRFRGNDKKTTQKQQKQKDVKYEWYF